MTASPSRMMVASHQKHATTTPKRASSRRPISGACLPLEVISASSDLKTLSTTEQL